MGDKKKRIEGEKKRKGEKERKRKGVKEIKRKGEKEIYFGRGKETNKIERQEWRDRVI
jgi:hypothetical protein